MSDEIYRGAELDSIETPTIWGRYERAIVTSGLSKAFGLPGLRIGWVVAPPELIDELWGVHDYTSIAPGALNDRLARVALAGADYILARTRGIVAANYPLVRKWIEKRAPALAHVAPEAGAIVFVRYRQAVNSTTLVERLRDEQSVLLVPGDHFDMDGYLRIGFGNHPALSGLRARARRRSPGRHSVNGCLRADLALVGFGNVARRFARLLEDCRELLMREYALDYRIVGVATRRRGGRYDPRGVDVADFNGQDSNTGRRTSPALGIIERLGQSDADFRVVVETTTLDIAEGEPAIDHVRAAFAAGCHVITANKGPVAFAYAALRDEAEAGGMSFLFEGAVMDGIPIFNLVRETLPAVTLRGFRGVVNSTTNHILTALERGEPFEAALARMQSEGIAEADASLDIDGWDAAAKAAALANVLLDARISPHAVRRTGIQESDGARARQALADGKRLKLVASAVRERDGGVSATVEPVELPSSDILAGLRRQSQRPRAADRSPGRPRDLPAGGKSHAHRVRASERSRHDPEAASAARSAGSSNPLIGRPSTTVRGTTRKPSARSASYAESSSSTFLAVNAWPSRERNSFTRSQLCQLDPVYTMMSVAIMQFYVA